MTERPNSKSIYNLLVPLTTNDKMIYEHICTIQYQRKHSLSMQSRLTSEAVCN